MKEFEPTLTYLDFVATDPDMVAYYELQTLGHVESVDISPVREDILLHCDHDQLVGEIMRDYGIELHEAINAQAICISGIHKRQLDMQRELYGEA